MACTAADLINIQPLALSDTFNTWFDRTNNVIASVNDVNVFDVAVGPTNGGLIRETGCSAGFYNGVVTLYVNPGAGIGIGVPAFTNNYNKVVMDATRLEDLGAGTGSSAANPSVGDYVFLSDASDLRQGAYGTPKRTSAERMLPPVVRFDDTFTIQGNVNIVGNLNVANDVAYIDSNDLRIEDKLIELAYNRYVEFTVFGAGFTSGTFPVGLTAFYHDTLTPTSGNATTIGTISHWSSGYTGATSDVGASGSMAISSFSEGGVVDIVLGGKLVVTGSAITSVLTVSGFAVGEGTNFYNDQLLQPSGLWIRGSESDKHFVWVCSAAQGAQNWNAFITDKNLGVSGPDNWILSSKFASYGYSDSTVDNTFTFLGAPSGTANSFTRFDVKSTLIMKHSPTGNAGITFGNVFIGESAIISAGSVVYPGVVTSNWTKHFNADQLDGAHASTAAAPWTIPVGDVYGKIDANFFDAEAIRKVFCQTGQSFALGNVLRYDFDGTLTFARANNEQNAEALGIVSGISGNCFTVTSKGWLRGITGTGGFTDLLPLVTGNAYFLNPDVGGRLVANVDSGGYTLEAGEVRKAMFVAAGSNSGYVQNYTGIVVGDSPTDLVYLRSIAPVGSVHPFAGSVSQIPDGWLVCNGARKSQTDYNDLYNAIEHNHYAEATVSSVDNFEMVGDTRGISAGDVLRFEATPTSPIENGIVSSVNTATRVITLTTSLFPVGTIPTGTALKVYGVAVASTVGNSVFFLPDMRRRTVFGTSSGAGLAGSGFITPQIGLGNATVQQTSAVSSGSGINAVVDLPPYVSMHWIIRSKKGLQATVLTGHNHDLYYIRHNAVHTITGGAANDLTEGNRTQFRANARVLRNDSDDTLHGSLTVEGSSTVEKYLNVMTVTGISANGFYNSSAIISNSRNLMVDIVSGQVSVRPNFGISETGPPASASNYPEGFVWYRKKSSVTAPVLSGETPVGGIIMFSGNTATLPTNWKVCNGTGGTPNLRDRFIVGAGSTYTAGDQGGSTNIPDHKHWLARNTVDNNNDVTFSARSATEAIFDAIPSQPGSYRLNGDEGPDEGNDTENAFASGGSYGLITPKTVVDQATPSLPPYHALVYIMRMF